MGVKALCEVNSEHVGTCLKVHDVVVEWETDDAQRRRSLQARDLLSHADQDPLFERRHGEYGL